MSKPKVVIIGGGSAALFFAAQIDGHEYDVTLYEQNATLGRKFLVAGKGGLNLSYDEDVESMISRYLPIGFMSPYIYHNTKEDFVKWLESIGIKTFVGTSKRIFPVKDIKPTVVLENIISQIENNNVQIKLNHKFVGFSENGVFIESNSDKFDINGDYYIWALGGASWKKTGSNGRWIDIFDDAGIKTIPFEASNSAIKINWPKEFLKINESKALKNILIESLGKSQTGEVVITSFGLEGNAIYPLSYQIRKQLSTTKKAIIKIDLKPMLSLESILIKLNSIDTTKPRTKEIKKKLNFGKLKMSMIKTFICQSDFLDNQELAKAIKSLPLHIDALAPIDHAISTVGGVALSEVDKNLQLHSKLNHYIIGEMLDWDAPTGGYLLQASWSMASYIASVLRGIIATQ